MKSDDLIIALDLILVELGTGKDGDFGFQYRDEILAILSEVFEEIYYSANIKKIENKVRDVREIDVNAIGSLFKLIDAIQPSSWSYKVKNEVQDINVIGIIKSLKENLKTIQESQHRMGQLEALFRLELVFDSNLDYVLASDSITERFRTEIMQLILSKLKLISDDQIMLMWARVKSSFSRNEPAPSYKIYDDIIPNEFWNEVKTVDKLRVKYSELIVKYKPLSVRRMLEDGYSRLPINILGITRILGISNKTSMIDVSQHDVLLIRSLSYVAYLFKSISGYSARQLAQSINANSKSYVFSGEYFNEYDQGSNKTNYSDAIRRLPSALKRSLLYAKHYLSPHHTKNSIEHVLWTYKLGQEIVAPSRNTQIKKMNELKLQKELSKYLIERGIVSFGTKLGRNEIDLYAKGLGEEDFVVEVKKYVEKSTPTLSKIKTNLTQLFSYMDSHSQPRGILFLYNLTNKLTITPKVWIKDRVWIVCVNLCPKSPSGRKKSMEIIESTKDDQYISAYENA